MDKFFRSSFAVILASAWLALGCGGGPATQTTHGGTGSHGTASTSASTSGSGAGGDATTSTATSTGAGGGSGGAGGAPMVTQLFVDALGGNDANPGTEQKPFKTLTRALSIATSGQTVELYSGTYDQINGETFPEAVPDGVTVAAVVAGEAVVMGDPGSSGGDVIGVEFAGGGTLRNLQIQGFESALGLSGSANVTCEGCAISNGGAAFALNDDARLTMTGGELYDLGPSCSGAVGYTAGASLVTLDGVNVHDIGSSFSLQDMSNVILQDGTIDNVGSSGCAGSDFEGDTFDMQGSSGLELDGTTVSGGPGWAIMVWSGAGVVLTNASISSPNGIDVAGDTEVTIDGTTFSGVAGEASGTVGVSVGSAGAMVTMTNASIGGFGTGVLAELGATQLRGTTIENVTTAVVVQGGSVDLGSLADPGGNTLKTEGTGLEVWAGADVLVQAVGNTWIPSVQGADASGHYTFGELTGPYGLTAPSPCNFSIAAGSKVDD
jgi:hypothetical protein